MIKINLLGIPKARKVKKRAEAQSQMILIGLVLFFVGVICSYQWFGLNREIKRLETSKAEATQELNDLKEQVKEVSNFEANKKKLEEKNQIIEQLKKNQSGPVRVLDEISRNLEPLKIWLVSLSVTGGSVQIDGMAITNTDIVEFISGLKASKNFTDISLIESRQVMEANIPIYSFRLRSTFIL